MSLISRIFRSDPFDNPNIPMTSENVAFFTELFGGGRTDSNEIVTPLTALQATALWCCVSLISEQIAIAPRHIYQIQNGKKELALDHPLYDLVHSQPNPEQSSVPFWIAVMMGLLLDGNSYIELQRDNGNRITAMWPRDPVRTTPVRWKGMLWYQTTDTVGGQARLIDARDMVHIMGATLDGWKGLSPIAYARQTIGTHLAMDRFGARLFANFATPSIAIEVADEVDAKTKAQMREEWERLQSGSNSHRVAIMDQGAKVTQYSLSPEDAQYIQSRQVSDREIARIYHVPPHMIGDLERAVKSNIEQQAIDLLNYCLKPYFARIETALTGKLFPKLGRAAGKYVIKHDTREMLRGDGQSRQSYIVAMLQNGIFTINEAREMEGLNPIGPEGDEHYVPLNCQTAAMALAMEPQPNPDKPDSKVEIMEEEEENALPRPGAETRDLISAKALYQLRRILRLPSATPERTIDET